MFTLNVSLKDQKTVFAGLANHDDVKLNSAKNGGVFKHKTGLQATFQGSDKGIAVTVTNNPENVPEAEIQSRFEDDVKLILSAAR